MTTSNGTVGSTICDITWTGDPADPQDVRLRAALLDAHRRLTALSNKPETVEAAGKSLQRANEEAGRPARYVAWDCLHQFDDELLLAMDDQERAARWCTLRAEADEKLKGSWRAKAAEFLIKQAPADKPVPVSIVRELQAHVATAAQNQQHKLQVFDQSMPWLTALLGLAVAASLAFSYIVFSTERFVILKPWAEALALGVPAGALGGILSMRFPSAGPI